MLSFSPLIKYIGLIEKVAFELRRRGGTEPRGRMEGRAPRQLEQQWEHEMTGARRDQDGGWDRVGHGVPSRLLRIWTQRTEELRTVSFSTTL